MDTLTWVNLAAYKDAGREYLQRAYRDKAAIVATDGHRLHIASAPLIDRPHYVDGYTAQEFVNYVEFSQPLNEEHFRGVLQIRKHERAALKALTKMDRALTLTFEHLKTQVSCNWEILGVKLTREEEKRQVKRDEVKGAMTATLDAWFFRREGKEDMKLIINGEYLLDAAIGEHCYRMYWAGDTNPVYLINEALGHRAVIMPIRPPGKL